MAPHIVLTIVLFCVQFKCWVANVPLEPSIEEQDFAEEMP
jgi:hypothetical protein